MKCLVPHINRIDKYKFFSVGIVSFSVSERKGDSISASPHASMLVYTPKCTMSCDYVACYVLRPMPCATPCMRPCTQAVTTCLYPLTVLKTNQQAAPSTQVGTMGGVRSFRLPQAIA